MYRTRFLYTHVFLACLGVNRMEGISAVILSGGSSTRMGSDKAVLTMNGETFLERMEKNLAQAGELLLSVRDEQDYAQTGLKKVVDVYRESGPLAGLHAALKSCKYPVLFVTACDMPFVTFQMAEELYKYLTDDIEAVIPVGRDGRKHVLCGIYRKEAGKEIGNYLSHGGRRVTAALEKLRIRYVPVDDLTNGEKILMNLNTPKEYQELVGEYKIPVFSIVAYSGTGKTTFLERLIPELKKQGYRVAAVKHDGHDFEFDKEGKDSYRLTEAGADVTGLISASRAVLMENRESDPEEVIAQIRDVDVILTEGFKAGKWPKIMIHRSQTGNPLPLEPARCLAVVSDIEIESCNNQFTIQDVKGVAALIASYIGKRSDR